MFLSLLCSDSYLFRFEACAGAFEELLLVYDFLPPAVLWETVWLYSWATMPVEEEELLLCWCEGEL